MSSEEPRLHGSECSSHARLRAAALALAVSGLVALFTACGETRYAQRRPLGARTSRVEVYVQARSPGSPPVSLRFVSAGVREVGGELHPLELRRGTVRADEALARVVLAGAEVPPGAYDALVLELAGAAEHGPGGLRELRLTAPGEQDLPEDERPPADAVRRIELPVALTVGRRRSASVFLDWDVEATRQGGLDAWPVFGTTLEAPQTRLGSLYAADASTDTVLAVDRLTGQVVGTGKVGPEPSALAVSDDRRRLFVANSADGSLTILDTRRHEFETTIPIRLGADPRDVAVVEAGRLVATANRGLDSVSFFDVSALTRVRDVAVGRSPTRLAALPSRRRVFVVGSLSDDLSVIDVATLNVIAVLRTESRPTAVAPDRRGDEVFVGHGASPHLLVIDASSLATVETIFVGESVSAVLADRRRDRVYVARTSPPELVVVDRRLAAVVRRIPLSGRVENLAQPLEGAFVYGACPDRGRLLVVDVLASREEEPLTVGGRPVDVADVD